MLRSRKVTAGKYYVNNARAIVREVLRINDETVLFNNHHLDTGNSCGSPSECTMPDFIRWVDHEATPAEMASLQNRKVEGLLHEPQIPDQAELNRMMVDRPQDHLQ